MEDQNQKVNAKPLDPMTAAKRIAKILEPFSAEKAQAVLQFVQALRQ